MAKKRFDVLSPDGIPISREDTYKDLEEAKTALDKWIQRYSIQGYYSTRGRRIPLSEIADHCEIVPIQIK